MSGAQGACAEFDEWEGWGGLALKEVGFQENFGNSQIVFEQKSHVTPSVFQEYQH